MSNSMSSSPSVVITGLGIFSPLGIGIDPVWEHLSLGRSGIAPLERLEYTAAPRNVGGEVREFTESSARKLYLKKLRKSIKVMCREIQMGVASALQAVEHSGLDLEAVEHARMGIDFGANLMSSPPDVLKDPSWQCVDEEDATRQFHFERWGNAGRNAESRSGMAVMEPLWLLKYLPNMPACHIGIALDARGPNNSLTLDEASGNLAVGEACRILQRGAADIMIAGVTGTRVHPVKTLHAALWDELAEYPDDPPATWCRPFDASRTGQVVGEGACSFVLETEEAAKARGATIYGRILGTGSSCVADRNGNAHLREALANAMRSALRDAGLTPADIGHINAHGLATADSDRQEAAAIHDVFASRAAEVPVTALKSYFGNAGSSCGLLELTGSLLGLHQNVVPPTLNYETPDPECPLNVVHGEPLSVANKTVLNINVTRMGQASAAIVQVD